jgi:hypothetical protein
VEVILLVYAQDLMMLNVVEMAHLHLLLLTELVLNSLMINGIVLNHLALLM